MNYCRECDRHFQTVYSLRQHRKASSRHTFGSWASSLSNAAPVVSQTQVSTVNPQMSLFGTKPVVSVTQAPEKTAEAKPSDELIHSLKRYAYVPCIFFLLNSCKS